MKKLAYCLALMILVSSCNQFSGGSYALAEIYQFNIEADALVKALTYLKTSDTSLKVPGNAYLTDGVGGTDGGHWYHFYFWNREHHEIYHFWVREQGPGNSTLGFVGVNSGTKLGNWQRINDDYNQSANEVKKMIFERFVLNRLSIKHQ